MHSGVPFAYDILLAPRPETGLGQVASELGMVEYLELLIHWPTCFQLTEEIPSPEQSAHQGGGQVVSRPSLFTSPEPGGQFKRAAVIYGAVAVTGADGREGRA